MESEGLAGRKQDVSANMVYFVQLTVASTICRLLLRYYTTKTQRAATRRIKTAQKLLKNSANKRRSAIIECYIEMQCEKIVLGKSLHYALVARDKAKAAESPDNYKQGAMKVRQLQQLIPMLPILGPFLLFEFGFRKTNFVIAEFANCVNPAPLRALWAFGAMGNPIECNYLNAFWAFFLVNVAIYPVIAVMLMGRLHHVSISDRLELHWMVREMGTPKFTAVNLIDNEDLAERLPDIVEMEESALFNE